MSVALLPPDTGPTTAELLAALPHLGMHAMDGLVMEGVLLQAVADALGTPAWVVSAGHVRGQIAAGAGRGRTGCAHPLCGEGE